MIHTNDGSGLNPMFGRLDGVGFTIPSSTRDEAPAMQTKPTVTLDGNEIPLAQFCRDHGIRYGGGPVDLRGYAHALPAALTSIGGSVYLEGYAHALPAALTSIGGPVDLRGYNCTLPDWIISAGKDRRGYWFAALRIAGVWRVRAGCRDFSMDQALAHWGSGGQSDKPDCLALVENLASQIAARFELRVV